MVGTNSPEVVWSKKWRNELAAAYCWNASPTIAATWGTVIPGGLFLTRKLRLPLGQLPNGEPKRSMFSLRLSVMGENSLSVSGMSQDRREGGTIWTGIGRRLTCRPPNAVIRTSH